MKLFQRNRRRHDPMLVLNMSIFNLSNGWDRVFNPLKAHENGTEMKDPGMGEFDGRRVLVIGGPTI